MNRYTNNECSRQGPFECQCPYRNSCQGNTYSQRSCDNDRGDSREYRRGRECNSCSICNIFRRCN